MATFGNRRARRGAAWIAAAALTIGIGTTAGAAPTLRLSIDQPGDFTLAGNTLGWDCASTGPAPVVGTVGACGQFTTDTAPDVFWRSDDANGTAAANTSILPGQARSTAVLSLPSTATVTHAWLFWAGESTGTGNQVDDTVTLERPDGQGGTVFTQSVTAQPADQYGILINGTDTYFQAIADVTSVIQSHGAGAYRVGGFDLRTMVNYDQQITFASWALVVFYSDPNEPPRNLSLFDGLDVVGNQSAPATLSGSGRPFAMPQ